MTKKSLSSWTLGIALALAGATTLLAQAPPPLQGQRGQAAEVRASQGRIGQQAQEANLPAAPVVSPLASISAEITGFIA